MTAIEEELENLPDLDNVDDLSVDEVELDVEGLHDGNLHSVESYRRGMATINEEDYLRTEYAKSTKAAIDNCEYAWQLWVDLHAHGTP